MGVENEPRLIELPRFCDPRGNLSFVQDDTQIPFAIRRVSWMYDIPADTRMPLHDGEEGELLIVALAGAFEVGVTDSNGDRRPVFRLSRAYRGLYVPAGMECELLNSSTGAVAVLLSSTLENDEDD